MKPLRIISAIWKSGANIYLDKKDNRIAIKQQNLIPAEVMQAAEQNFQAIDEWFKSWDKESNEKITLMKMIHQLCGWQHNEKLNNWLCTELESLDLLVDWTSSLAINGWNDIYTDFREFENEESNKLAKELYIRAVTYAKKGVEA
ncbi:hypothetical protein P9858_20260 [Niallia circulans]|uniref:hypothetical protein n=1 Tax=Niallia circulans TaxID=1397 RepID=UPI002E23AAEA|nr:hypothetical protein [Niallia circulans]